MKSQAPRPKRLAALFPMGFKHKKEIVALTVMGAACILAAPKVAEAFAAPAAGTFAFDIYDIGVNQILKGPIGFAAGVGSMVAAAVMAGSWKWQQDASRPLALNRIIGCFSNYTTRAST